MLVFGPLAETTSTKTPKPNANTPTTPVAFLSTNAEPCTETEFTWGENEIGSDAASFEVEPSNTEVDLAQMNPISSDPIPNDEDNLFTPFTVEENLEPDETKFERISNLDPHFTSGLVELLMFVSNQQLPAKETPSLSLNGSILTSLQRLRI